MIQSDNVDAFVEQNLVRFTESVQAAFAQMLAQAEGQMAEGLYTLLNVIDSALRKQERAGFTPQQLAMLDEVIALDEREERASYEQLRLLCQHLLSTLSQAQTPRQWASLYYTSGGACFRLYELTSDHQYAQAAQSHYSAALEVYRREVAPADWAMTQHALGNLFSRLYERTNQQEQAQAAQSHYTAALEVRKREVAASQWAMTQHALGTLFSRLYERTNQQEQAQQAEAHYQEALTEWTPLVAPDYALRAARSLARLYMGLERWAEAEEAYQTALEAAQKQYLVAGSDSERRRLMADHATLFAEDAFCLHQLGQIEAAWLRLDEGRARLLGETIGLEQAARLHHGAAAVYRLGTARQQLALAEADLAAKQALQYQADNPAAQETYQQSLAAVRSAWEALQQLVAELELAPPTLNANQLAKLPLPPDTAALALLLGDKSSHALLLHQGKVTSIPLPATCTKAALGEHVSHLPPEVEGWWDAFNARQEALRALVAASAQAERETESTESTKSSLSHDWERVRVRARVRAEEAQAHFQAALEEIAQSRGDALRSPSKEGYQAGWYQSYRMAFGITFRQGNPQAQHATFTAWQNKIKETVDFLAKEFWPAIVAKLPTEVKQLLLIPSGVTSLLPLHAAAPADPSVAYIPSLSIWQRCQQRATNRKADTLFLATPATDLPFTEAEAEWLTYRFPEGAIKRLLQAEATADAIRTQASGHGIVHFSGHAAYDWDDPNQSVLACKDSTLSLATIRRQMDLSHARLVTLSACETGITDVQKSGEEFIGLPAGLLEAGTPAVVASLWPVHDVSTAFLMDRFYELWLTGEHSINQALQQAAQWLQHATKADLIQRIAASLPPDEQTEVLELAKLLMTHDTPRMAMPIVDNTIMAIISKPDEHPFAHPFYWAAFAAYGAVE